jgi:hypothetical protein
MKKNATPENWSFLTCLDIINWSTPRDQTDSRTYSSHLLEHVCEVSRHDLHRVQELLPIAFHPSDNNFAPCLYRRTSTDPYVAKNAHLYADRFMLSAGLPAVPVLGMD